MDGDANRLAAAISAALIVVLLAVAGVGVRPFVTVEQEHVLYQGNTTTTVFEHPSVLPATAAYSGSGALRTTLGEELLISPYDRGNGTAGWRCKGDGGRAEYVCRLTWETGYSVSLAGITVFEGSAPWKAGSLTLVDAPGAADGGLNLLHMPENVRLDEGAGPVTG